MDKGFINGIILLVASGAAGAGFLLGSQARPQTEMSQLASAQLISGDKKVAYIGHLCGDDGATVLSREMPDINECKDISILD